MENIGNKEIVYTKQYIIPENDTVNFDTHVEGWLVKVSIQFEIIPNKTNELRVEVDEGVKDKAKIILTNWNNSLGTATIAPVTIGKHANGKTLSFMLVNYTIGKTNFLSIQLLLGGQNA
jgi:hypothetical protein